jgi:N-acetyl-gamma-glutamyl-phosphate reductase/acetylglutamate kinase
MWWGSELAGNGEGVGAVAKRFFASESASSSSSSTSPLPPRPVAKGDSTTPSSKKSIRLGLLGARGFVGRELLTLLAGHSSIEVVCASSRALVGQPVAEALGVPAAGAACTPGLTFSDVGPAQLAVGAHPSVDAWILALPNGLCATHEAAIQAAAAAKGVPMPLLLDLSADQRFQAKGGPWVYGLPERHGAREALRTARKIANPGCYATGSQAALLPLLPGGVGVGSIHWDAAHRPHIFGVSGYSGAGTTPSEKNDPNRLR